MEFLPFHVILSKKDFSELGQTPCGGEGIENISFKFHSIPIMNVFHELVPQPPPLVLWGGVANMSYLQL